MQLVLCHKELGYYAVFVYDHNLDFESYLVFYKPEISPYAYNVPYKTKYC